MKRSHLSTVVETFVNNSLALASGTIIALILKNHELTFIPYAVITVAASITNMIYIYKKDKAMQTEDIEENVKEKEEEK